MSARVTTHSLVVPGARLYYEVRGAGPLLVVLGSPMPAAATHSGAYYPYYGYGYYGYPLIDFFYGLIGTILYNPFYLPYYLINSLLDFLYYLPYWI